MDRDGQRPQAVAGVPRLFVGMLPANTTEAVLLPIFEAHGRVEKITLVKGAEDRSKGCAFVQYSRWADAEAAVDAINGTCCSVNGSEARPLVCHFANPRRLVAGPQGGETAIAVRKLFVGQIPKSATEAQLREVFEAFGAVEHVNVLHSKGVHAGCAFVQYARWASCEAAIAALHDRCVMPGSDHALVVKFADAKRADVLSMLGSRGRAMVPGMHTYPGMMMHGHHAGAYMGGEMAHMASMQHAAMGHHPQVAHLGLPAAMGLPGQMMAMPPPPMGGRMRRGGVGGSSDSLLSGSDASDSAHALAPLSGSMLSLDGTHSPVSTASGALPHPMPPAMHAVHAGGVMLPHGMSPYMADPRHAMHIMHAAAMAAQQQHMVPPRGGKVGRGVTDASVYAHKLFIGQVPFEATEGDLWHMFAPCGDILELAVLRANGRSKGCGFLTLATRAQALGAISAFHGCQIAPGKRLVVKFADQKSAAAAPASPVRSG